MISFVCFSLFYYSEYGTGNDELIFEVCEQKWFGREQLIGSATSSISDLLHKKHVSLADCPGMFILIGAGQYLILYQDG